MAKDNKKLKDKINLTSNDNVITEENRSASPGGGNTGGVAKSAGIFTSPRHPLKVMIPKSDSKRLKDTPLSNAKNKSNEKLSPKSKSTFYTTTCRPTSLDSLGLTNPSSNPVSGDIPSTRENIQTVSLPGRPICGEDGTSYSLNTYAPVSSLAPKPELIKRNSSTYADNSHSNIDKKFSSSLPREMYTGSVGKVGLLDQHTSDISSSQLPLILNTHSRSTPEMIENSRNGSRGNYYNDEYEIGLAAQKIEVGDRVAVRINDKECKGVVRCRIERPPNGCDESKAYVVVFGLEMDEPADYGCDGVFNKKKYFECPKNTGLFLLSTQCQPLYQDFGGIPCPIVEGVVSPPFEFCNNIAVLCGRNKGIQGHYNSCYLDATLFSMFAFTTVFDDLLFRPKNEKDIDEYNRVQEVLHRKIVNPLRQSTYVRADRVMELRELLDVLGSVSGLTCEEKDPEEFLNSLLQQILKAKPLLQLSSGQESYYYQLFVEKDEKINLPTVQYLLEQSLHNSNVKLKEIPSCLITLMPRFGKSFKVYPRIFPSLHLDVTDIIENYPRSCSCCGLKIAEMECLDCFNETTDPINRWYAFCMSCFKRTHDNTDRRSHKANKLEFAPDFLEYKDHSSVKSAYMDLFAVVCIETSHYVSFVKCGEGPDSSWCFFDSMADRKGEQNGYNIPEISECPDLSFWLSDECHAHLTKFYTGNSTEQQPPNYVKRLLNDVYMCMYRSTDVCMYK